MGGACRSGAAKVVPFVGGEDTIYCVLMVLLKGSVSAEIQNKCLQLLCAANRIVRQQSTPLRSLHL
jgi:hypothetical protein